MEEIDARLMEIVDDARYYLPGGCGLTQREIRDLRRESLEAMGTTNGDTQTVPVTVRQLTLLLASALLHEEFVA